MFEVEWGNNIFSFNTSTIIPRSELVIPGTIFAYQMERTILVDFDLTTISSSESTFYRYQLKPSDIIQFHTLVPIKNHYEYLKLKYG